MPRGKRGRQPAWSGMLAFGLVTLPVELYPTTRDAGVTLRMVAEDGTPLKRRYYCPKDGKILQPEEIVRGYPVASGEFVVVEDEELDALDPERSGVIDLREFVPLADLDPSYVLRSYLLVPDRDAVTAYRLLVAGLADQQRAGMATFVMRGRSHVVAIISTEGSLRALTLRYPDELRSPEQIGLPKLESAPAHLVKRLEQAMAELAEDELDPAELEDEASRRIRELALGKLEQGVDVRRPSKRAAAEPLDDDEPADVMELLKRSLATASQQRDAGA